MDSPKFEIPIFLRWKVSKVEIQKEFQYESSLKKSIELPQLSGISYYLSISKSNGQIFIGLGFAMKEETTIDATFIISIFPANKFNGKFEESAFGKENGYEKANVLCLYHDFLDPAKNYFMGGYICLTMEGILSIEKEQIRSEIDIKSPENLGEILYNREDKNFDISTGDGKILKVHLLVTAAQIPIFQQLKESNQTKFIIPDFDYEIIELAMKFCYGILTAENLNASIAIKLLQFSIKYQISDLKDSMEEYLLKEKSPMNICEIVNASILMNLIKLREQCFDFMLKCMKESRYINDLEKLDKEFALVLLKTSFSVFNV